MNVSRDFVTRTGEFVDRDELYRINGAASHFDVGDGIGWTVPDDKTIALALAIAPQVAQLFY